MTTSSANFAMATHVEETCSFEPVRDDPRWWAAMSVEMEAIMNNETPDLVDRSPKRKVIGTKVGIQS